MKTDRELAMEVEDGVVAMNAEPWNIMDYGVEELRRQIDEAGEVMAATPETTDEYEWETMCLRLDLVPEKTRRIFIMKEMGTEIGYLASDKDYDI